MDNLIAKYEDYYLVKCFNKEQYRADFNNGAIYFKDMSYFPNAENDFQQDEEGVVFRQAEKSYGTIYTMNSPTSEYVSDLMKSGNVFKGIELIKTQGNKVAETNKVLLNIEGFLCCFYLIPKRCLNITNKNIDISPEKEYANFFQLLDEYAKNTGYVFFSIYNALQLIEIISRSCKENHYNFTFGCIDYQDVDEQTKIKWFSEGQIEKIVFTKPLRFHYQREFRFFLSPCTKNTSDSIIINSDSLENITISSLAYLTQDYCRKLKEGYRNEIQF